MVNRVINPYNFVSIEKVERKPKDSVGGGSYTGCIDYTVRLHTDLIIPNTSTNRYLKNQNESASYGYYSYEDLTNKTQQKAPPVIPGSEVRGVTRLAYQVLTNSCLGEVSEKGRISVRPGKNLRDVEPVILEYNEQRKKWEMYYAEESDASDYDVIYKGYEKCSNKPRTRYYFRYDDAFIRDLKDEKGNSEIELLLANLDTFQNEKRYDDLRRKIKNHESCVVYLVKDGYMEYLSPASNSRVTFKSTIKEKVPFDGSSCKGKDRICATCSLFGMIDDEKSLSSKVRFTDAECESDSYEVKGKTTFVLGSPVVNNINFYGLQNGNSWNWDNPNVSLRGRKFYWHHPVKYFDAQNLNPNMAASFFPIAKGSSFKGKVYFEGLTQVELDTLIFALSLGEGSNMHKIGHAKPLGYGSIKINIDQVKLKEITLKEGKLSYEENNYDIRIDMFGGDLSRSIKEFKKITDFNGLSPEDQKIVTYPSINGQIFKWFMKNQKTKLPLILNSQYLYIDGDYR